MTHENDIDLMRDVYMTKAQREAFDRILCRATAEQAGKVEDDPQCQECRCIAYQRGDDEWECVNCGLLFVHAKPTQPAATQMPVAWQYRVDVHRDGNWSDWRPCTENFHDEIIEFGECVEGDDPRGVIADARTLYAAPVSPSREVEALRMEITPKGYGYKSHQLRVHIGDQSFLVGSGPGFDSREEAEWMALFLEEALSKLAPVQEKAP